MPRPLAIALAVALLACSALGQGVVVGPPIVGGPTQIAVPGARLEVIYTPDGVSNGAQEMAIWLPTSPPPENGYPIVVLFPGGGWRDPGPLPENPGGVLRRFRDRGIAAAFARYSHTELFPVGAQFPQAERDTQAVVQHLRFNAAQYRIDPEQIVLSGRSAGGHGVQAAAMWPDAADTRFVDQRRESSKPLAVILNSVGATHVPALKQGLQTGISPYLGTNFVLGSVPVERQLEMSPTHWLTKYPGEVGAIPFQIFGSPRPLDQRLGQPYVLDVLDHNHNPWNSVQLALELYQVGGVHRVLSEFVDVQATALSVDERQLRQVAWVGFVLQLQRQGVL